MTPKCVLVVNDGEPWEPGLVEQMKAIVRCSELVALRNTRRPGLAGAWNSGLEWIARVGHRGYVAFLDDDDLWNADHLFENRMAALGQEVHVVVSGLRMLGPHGPVQRELIRSLSARDFLIGNPGWQGSNTFVRADLMALLGGFREELSSCHDRDLAIRVLKTPGVRTALVPRWTATWCADGSDRLSSWRNPKKRSGLQMFLQIYRDEMTTEELDAFFTRSLELFGFSRDEIEGRPA